MTVATERVPVRAAITDRYAPSGFFVLRTPLLPFEDFERLAPGPAPDRNGEDPGALESPAARIRASLREALSRPAIRDALETATPDLARAVDEWTAGGGRNPRRLESALMRYLARMAGRATPFGLFAGWSVGTIGSSVSLELPPRSRYRRHVRLDGGWLHGLLARIERDPAVRRGAVYRPNECLYALGGQWRYPETRVHRDRTPRVLVALDDDAALRDALVLARDGVGFGDLAGALADRHGVGREEAEGYVDQLIDAQVLLSDLRIVLTGSDPFDDTLARLAGNPAITDLVRDLRAVATDLAELGGAEVGAVSPERHRSLVDRLRSLHDSEHIRVPIRTELQKDAAGLTLPAEVTNEILRGVELIHRVFGQPTEDHARLAAFREAFAERYGEREVALLEALDEEAGVPFDASAAAAVNSSPLLAAISVEPEAEPPNLRWTRTSAVFLRAVLRGLRRGQTEVRLDPGDLPEPSTGILPLPDAFVANCTIIAENEAAIARGEYDVLLRGINGPSGVRSMGRFCALDGELQRHVSAHLRAEEALVPGVRFAEVVHLPSPSTLHIVARPVLREYEIPLLGCSGTPSERQIPLDDLYLSVRQDRLVLTSARLGCEVRVRLTAAHNYAGRGMLPYRFLCMLQSPDVVTAMGWEWGPLHSATFLPRIRVGRIVLYEARWRFEPRELEFLRGERGDVRPDALRRWREEWSLPRHVGYMDGDQVLPVDLANELSVSSFLDVAGKLPVIMLKEMLPGPSRLCVRGPEGRYVHELFVPYVRRPDARVERPATAAGRPLRHVESRSRSEWLYVKLYLAESAADRVLRQVVQPLVQRFTRDAWIDRWFYIRYRDPDFHLRVRFRGDPSVLRASALPALFEAGHPLLEDGRIRRIVLDTYRPEYARYFGEDGVEAAERIFHADSEASLGLLACSKGDDAADLRWQFVLLGMDRFLDDLGLDLNAKAALLARVADSRARLVGMQRETRVRAAEFFRSRKANLVKLVEDAEPPGPMATASAILRERSLRLARVFSEGRGEAAREFVVRQAHDHLHLFNNRLLRCSIVLQEAILFDFLRRLYESRVARGAPQPPGARR